MGAHWLAERIARIRSITPEFSTTDEAAREARRIFVGEVTHLVEELARKPGVTAAFAMYEGFVVAASGVPHERAEALAAASQSGMGHASDMGTAAALGAVRQLVVVGDEAKLALIRLGPLDVGVLSPSHVDLGATTAR